MGYENTKGEKLPNLGLFGHFLDFFGLFFSTPGVGK